MLKNFKDTTNRECVTSKLVEERGNKGIKNTREKKKQCERVWLCEEKASYVEITKIRKNERQIYE